MGDSPEIASLTFESMPRFGQRSHRQAHSNHLKPESNSLNAVSLELPRALQCDNDLDFTSAAVRRCGDGYGFKPILRPVATPHHGEHIERLIGTMMGRVNLLSGTASDTRRRTYNVVSTWESWRCNGSTGIR